MAKQSNNLKNVLAQLTKENDGVELPQMLHGLVERVFEMGVEAGQAEVVQGLGNFLQPKKKAEAVEVSAEAGVKKDGSPKAKPGRKPKAVEATEATA